MAKSRSQSALPQKRQGWGSTALPAATNLQLDFMVGSSSSSSSSRPTSSMHRGGSSLRPQSSRHAHLMEPHPPDPPLQSKLERPQSGIHQLSRARPLSGRVFMRQSRKHGWVAKAYPQAGSSHSQPDLLGSDIDLISSGSLDSFFDDDFEEENEEKLGSLLSCNTLGVESKPNRRDWVSGEVGVPKFHCPRCRDHWYGYSSVPCDEELARLIREGLWYTGNKDKMPQGTYQPGMFVPGDSQAGATGEDASTNGSTQRGKLPRLKSSYKKSGSLGNGDWNREGSDKSKRRKKKITFKLEDSASDGSSTDLISDGSCSSIGRRGKTSSLGKDDGGGGGLGGDSRAGNLAERQGEGMNEEDGGYGGGSDGRFGRGSNGKDGYSKGKVGKFGDQSNSGSDHQLSSANSGSVIADKTLLSGLVSSNSRNFNAVGKLSDLQGNSNGLQGENSLSGGGGHRGGEFGSSENSDKTSTGSRNHDGRPDKFSTTTEGSSLSNGFSQSGGDGRRHKDSSSADNKEGMKLGVGGVRSSGAKSSGEGRGSGGALMDHGKRIRKSGGYMKTVSPTSSEWGDHLHARSFISSSVHSRSGSVSSLSGVKGGGVGEKLLGEKDKGSLPPIVPRIIGTDDHLSGWRPNITRAWTFSYFSASAD